MTNEEMILAAGEIIINYGLDYARHEHVNWLIKTGVHPKLAVVIVEIAVDNYVEQMR